MKNYKNILEYLLFETRGRKTPLQLEKPQFKEKPDLNEPNIDKPDMDKPDIDKPKDPTRTKKFDRTNTFDRNRKR